MTEVHDAIIRVTTGNSQTCPIGQGGRIARIPSGERWVIHQIKVEPTDEFLIDGRKDIGRLHVYVNQRECLSWDLASAMGYGNWTKEDRTAIVDALTLYSQEAPHLVPRIAAFLRNLREDVPMSFPISVDDTDDLLIYATPPTPSPNYPSVTVFLCADISRPITY